MGGVTVCVGSPCQTGYTGAMTKKWIKGLDGLRAIAVGLVVFNHKIPVGSRINPGGYGVHLFFVLSGFLIVGILYGRREKIEAGQAGFGLELGHFYENRLFRIWPIYFLAIAIAWLASITGQTEPMRPDLMLSLVTFTTNLFQAYAWTDWPNRVGAMWSIAVEEQFYLWIAPVLLLAPRRFYPAIFTAVIATALLAGWVQAGMPQFPKATYVGPLTNFGLMAVGGLAAVSGGGRAWHARVAPGALLVFLALPVAVYVLHIGGFLNGIAFWGSGLLVAIVLLGVVANQHGLLVRLLELRPIKYIGNISYGIYIYHGLVELHAVNALRPHLPGQTLTGLLDAALSIAVASASWHLIEEPLLRLKDRRRLRRIEAKALAEAPALADMR